MIRLLFVLLVYWLTAAPSFAQTIIIRSGEHENFSRLVLTLPKKVDWTIVEANRSFSLQVDDPAVLFDFSQVFDRIPRKRLIAVTQEYAGSDLVFLLACDCSILSFSDNENLIVIDIKDVEKQQDKLSRTQGLSVSQIEYRFSVPDTEQKSTRVKNNLLPVVIGQVVESGSSTVEESTISRQPEGSYSKINISEERLLAQIMRASNQGLLELTGNSLSVNPIGQKELRKNMPAEMPESPMLLSLSATTVIDRDLAASVALLDRSSTGLFCTDPNFVAVNSWGPGKIFSVEVSQLRSQLYGEFDKLRPEAALKLARFYLFFGFGAEARQVVELSKRKGAEVQVMLALAAVLDAEDMETENPFAAQQNCMGDVALWSLLSEQTVAEKVNNDAILQAFSRLPPHLRERLGPGVIRKYVQAGNRRMANSVLRMTTRSGEGFVSGINFAEASVAELIRDTEKEKRELMNSVAEGTEYSPKALVELIGNKYEARETIAPDLPDLVTAYATEFRGTDIEGELIQTQVVALALAGRFAEAVSVQKDLQNQGKEREYRAALTSLITLMSERADDVTFLRYAMDSDTGESEYVSAKVGEQMAERLLVLGFPDVAEMWLEKSGDALSSEKRRMMQAEIEVARKQPLRALVELVGLSEPDANRLRAKALRQNGEYRQVGQVLTATEELNGAARAFWLAEEWKALPDQKDTHYAQVIEQSAQLFEVDPNTDQTAPLAQARLLMLESSEVRDKIAALLQKISVGSESMQ